MHLMITCINTVLIPLAASNVTVRRSMEKTTTQAVTRMEEKVNNIMQHTIDVTLSWVSKLLQNQKKGDFRPKDLALEGGGAWLEMLQTPVRPQSLDAYFLGHCIENQLTMRPDMSPNLHLPLQITRFIQRRPLTHLQKPPKLPNRARNRPPYPALRALQEIPSQRRRWTHGHKRYHQIHRITENISTGA